MSEKELEKLRKEITEIDNNVIEFLNKRGSLAKNIGEIKKKIKLDVSQPDRERQVIENIMQKSTVLKPENTQAIWKEIMGACKAVQGKIIKVGYLGPKGTFANQAAMEFFPKNGTDFIPYKNNVEIFDNIEKKILDYGVIPIENSLQGTVRDTLDLLIEKNLVINQEKQIRIIQNLIGLKDADDISLIKKIYSHPQPFAQSKSWLKSNLPNAKLINTNSTAEAVKMVGEMKDKTCAAIGTAYASNIYDLKIIASEIEDDVSNFTRFLVISNTENEHKEEKMKTSIVYVTKHTPGALFEVLKLFAEANINLSKIESRPRRTGKWEYIFLMDFEGYKDDPKIVEVIEKMKQSVIWHKILGSYPF